MFYCNEIFTFTISKEKVFNNKASAWIILLHHDMSFKDMRVHHRKPKMAFSCAIYSAPRFSKWALYWRYCCCKILMSHTYPIHLHLYLNISSFSSLHVHYILTIPSHACLPQWKQQKEREVKMAYKTTADLPGRGSSRMSNASRSSSRMSSQSSYFADSDSSEVSLSWSERQQCIFTITRVCCAAFIWLHSSC